MIAQSLAQHFFNIQDKTGILATQISNLRLPKLQKKLFLQPFIADAKTRIHAVCCGL